MQSLRSRAALLSALVLLCGSLPLATPLPAVAQTQQQAQSAGTISGQVLDERNALPVAGANVVVARGSAVVARTTTGSDGRYTLPSVAPGFYDLTISAPGYTPSTTTGLAIVAGVGPTTANATLVRAATSSTGADLRVIGRTSTSARNSLASATTISQDISVENLTRTGQLRVVDQITNLPAMNINTSSSPGDDVTVNMRGFGPGETQAMLDGHPIGPLGIGAPDSFNFADTPFFGLSNTQVTYGSGAQGLYGSDTIGGAVNFETINPTRQPHAYLQQQVGGFGRLNSGFAATGTIDRLGYAIAGGVSGLTGAFGPPSQYFQGARPSNVVSGSANPPAACNNSNGNDVSLCNQLTSTYALSQDTTLRTAVAKLQYDLSSTTRVSGTFYDAIQWGDSTGNGDNDYLPYSTRLAQIQNGSSNCTTASGAPGYTVTTDPIAGTTACYTAQQWAAVSYGGAGGGAGRQRSTSMRDYHMRVTSTLANIHHLTFDAYYNNYYFWKDSSLAGGIDPTGLLLGTPTFADYYNTHGYLISDDLTSARNDFGFGYFLFNQLQTGNQYLAPGFKQNPPAYFSEGSVFVRDDFRFNDQTSIFVNAWAKRNSITQKTTFDPRATVLFRPNSSDVVRFTYGRSDGAPAPELKQTGNVFVSDPGSSLTSVNCTLNSVSGRAGNPNLVSESANDFEFGYGHRIGRDSNIQVNAYVTNVTNQLVSTSEPVTAYGLNNITFAPGALATYQARLNAANCGGGALTLAQVVNYLAIPTSFNAANALARGVELSGRQYLNRIAYIDYAYSIENAMRFNLPNQFLQHNPTVINGKQLPGIPLHQASISFDVAPNPWEFRIDNYYMEQNNQLNRPSFWHSNAFLSRSFNHGEYLVTLGGTNIFNNAVQNFGYLGQGFYLPENQFFNDPNTLQEYLNSFGAEQFGLPPAQITLTLAVRR